MQYAVFNFYNFLYLKFRTPHWAPIFHRSLPFLLEVALLNFKKFRFCAHRTGARKKISCCSTVMLCRCYVIVKKTLTRLLRQGHGQGRLRLQLQPRAKPYLLQHDQTQRNHLIRLNTLILPFH